MTVRQRTQVGIVGAGPAGLLLSHLLALAGIDSIVVENRSRSYCEARQRAGMLESTTVELLREVGLGHRLDVEGLEHDGIYLQFGGERHHVNFRELTNGRWVTIYAQTEIVKDLIAARIADDAELEFNVTQTEVSHLDSDRPMLSYTDEAGQRHEVACDAIAGCDGFHGITRRSIPQHSLLTATERSYPYGWLGILAQAPPSTDEVIYCRHENGFALHSMRTPDEDIARWPDDRIWGELRHRMAVPGWELTTGPILEKSITPMRSFVAAPMRYQRLFLAGDAAHIVPPTGAKGLNLAVADVAALATALVRLVRDGRSELADAYSDHCLERVWRATHLACWMTTMMHVVPGQDDFESELQLAQLRNLVTSRAAATMLAENYTGYAPLRYDPATRLGPAALWASSVA
jgi:p-hydroxybenzoate 3-monooxygenase